VSRYFDRGVIALELYQQPANITSLRARLGRSYLRKIDFLRYSPEKFLEIGRTSAPDGSCRVLPGSYVKRYLDPTLPSIPQHKMGRKREALLQ
jgi:hypothetical protein